MSEERSGDKLILLVEDEEHIAEGLKLNLSLQGHRVMVAQDGASALRKWKEHRPDLVVLDIMLPGVDGLSVLSNIRLEDEKVPVLILSAKGSADDKVAGLSRGGDDYMAKPFHLEEFLLRVERLLFRAASAFVSRDSGPSSPGFYAFGGNRIDFDTFTAHGKAGKISLTEQEAKLLKLFVANRGKLLSRAELLAIGWGYTKATTTRTVDNFIVRFRKYFEDNPKRPVYFRSVRSVGYVFDHEDAGAERKESTPRASS